jgi:NADPH-dependent 2,4-dienoyl-CoA reductase/sulfur reductase-like enzyme
MPPFDPEMVQPMQDKLKAKGVELCLGDSVKGFKAEQVSRLVCCIIWYCL